MTISALARPVSLTIVLLQDNQILVGKKVPMVRGAKRLQVLLSNVPPYKGIKRDSYHILTPDCLGYDKIRRFTRT